MRGETDGRTDGRYQVHYLPRFAVDKKAYGTFVWAFKIWEKYDDVCQKKKILIALLITLKICIIISNTIAVYGWFMFRITSSDHPSTTAVFAIDIKM